MSYLSSIPYFEKTQENLYRVSIHADVLKIKRLNAPPPEHGVHKRDVVRGISKKSRKRMIETLAMVSQTPDFFLTMTYSDDVGTIEPESFRPHFEAFRRRLEYHHPDLKAIWRLEVEPRKSGDRQGELIVHFHLVIWIPNMDDETRNSLLIGSGKQWRAWWHEITGSTNEWHYLRYGLQLERIKSRRHAYHYVSKYVAKESYDDLSIGRRWGRVGELDTLPVFEMELSWQEYCELKRLIMSYYKRTRPVLYKMFKRMKPIVGLTAFGFGAWNDDNHGLFSSLIWKMLSYVIQCCHDKRRIKEESQ